MSDDISELLKGVDVEKLKEQAGPLLAMLKDSMANDETKSSETQTVSSESNENSSSGGSIDMATLAQLAVPLMSMMNGGKSGSSGIDPAIIKKLASAFSNDKANKNMQLLSALRPFLSSKRNDKMESAISIMRMTSMLSGMSD